MAADPVTTRARGRVRRLASGCRCPRSTSTSEDHCVVTPEFVKSRGGGLTRCALRQRRLPCSVAGAAASLATT